MNAPLRSGKLTPFEGGVSTILYQVTLLIQYWDWDGNIVRWFGYSLESARFAWCRSCVGKSTKLSRPLFPWQCFYCWLKVRVPAIALDLSGKRVKGGGKLNHLVSRWHRFTMRYQTLCATTIVIISTSKLQGSHLRLAAHVSWLGERSRASITSTWRSFTGWSDQDVWVWEQDCGTNICIAANLKIQAKTNPNTAMADLWATTISIVMMWRFANSTSLDFCRLPLWMVERPHETR